MCRSPSHQVMEQGSPPPGWDIVGHLIARDSILPDMSSLGPNDPKALQLGPLVFYGYLARNHADPTRYVAAIRGTNGFAEWVIDADFFLRDAPSSPGAKVEQGFWSVYDSMMLFGLDGVQIGAKAADGVASAVGQATVTICGHSLGSAVATYLSFDVGKLMGARASACLFASPSYRRSRVDRGLRGDSGDVPAHELHPRRRPLRAARRAARVSIFYTTQRRDHFAIICSGGSAV